MSLQPKKSFNKWLQLITIPIQMGLIIFFSALLGEWIDKNYPNPSKLYHVVCVLSGVFIALYHVIIQVNKINKHDN